MDIPIPKDSSQAWKSHRGKIPQNPGLIFDRFAPDWGRQPTLKREGLTEVIQAAQQIDRSLLEALNLRWQNGVAWNWQRWNDTWEHSQAAANQSTFTLLTDWRVVAGLGRKGTYEVGFTFHRSGFPIIPGSSLKGLARAYALYALGEVLSEVNFNRLEDLLSLDQPEEYQKKLSADYPHASEPAVLHAARWRAVFGTPGCAGQAVFFDAIPARPPQLDLDVMNPHYPKYYEGKQPPSDWQDPVPVYFLTIGPQQEFRFAIGWRTPPDEQTIDLLTQAREWLVSGLAWLGAGAKTNAGYGLFSPQSASQTSSSVKQPPTSSGVQNSAAPSAKPPVAPAPMPPGFERGEVSKFGLGEHADYGFIYPARGGREIFVHASNLAHGVRTLKPGQKVIFKRVPGRRGGEQAAEVRIEGEE